jgi:hypothetical protein
MAEGKDENACQVQAWFTASMINNNGFRETPIQPHELNPLLVAGNDEPKTERPTMTATGLGKLIGAKKKKRNG